MAQFYLRSNDNYDHEFRLKRKGEDGLGIVWTLKGRSHNNKNISIIENEEDYKDIMSFEQVKQLMKRNVVSILNEIPRNFYSAMELASRNANLLAQQQVITNEKDTIINSKDEEIQRLKDKAKAAGIDLDS